MRPSIRPTTRPAMRLMTHIVAGYPTLKESEAIARTMQEAGVDFLEIQIPFSDPVADGPTILRANQVALQNGVTPEDCFELMGNLVGIQNFESLRQNKTNVLFMTYYNILHAYGVEAFCKRAREAGCYGLIVPDIPLDEEAFEHYLALCAKYHLNPIQVISPLTPDRRLKKIGKVAKGFVYCVSRFGTTGKKTAIDPKLRRYLTQVRKFIKVPLALGFGIQTAEQVKAAAKEAEIIVMGSKMINLYDEERDLKKIRSFLNTLVIQTI